MKNELLSVLFMDVSGWSKLEAHQIHDYVTTIMPQLGAEIRGQEFLNTWGDAIVATFRSPKDAAESALRIRDVFRRGFPRAPDLTCRISLHAGSVILANNALTGHEDIFGHAVHTAARLEPVTAPGYVFCTSTFAASLSDLGTSAPRTWPLGELRLPKDFGSVQVSAVMWPGEPDPGPALKPFLGVDAIQHRP